MFEGLFRPEHLLLILIICLLLFGPRRLPELGKGLGEAIKGFKDGIRHSDAPSTTAASTPAPVPENKTEAVQK